MTDSATIEWVCPECGVQYGLGSGYEQCFLCGAPRPSEERTVGSWARRRARRVTEWLQAGVDRLRRLHTLRSPLGLGALAIVLHGPVDVGLTAAHWSLEANPLVQTLGLEVWLALKTLLVGAIAPLAVDARHYPAWAQRAVRACLAVLVALGLTLVVPNLVALLGGGPA